MLFPKILPESEDLKRIPNPEDFGLDMLVNSIFLSRRFVVRDVDTGEFYGLSDEYPFPDDDEHFRSGVLSYARNLMFHPETDSSKVQSRQELLTTFMASPELMKFVRAIGFDESPDFDSKSWRYNFNTRFSRAKTLLSSITDLAQILPETTNSELEEFRQYVIDLVSDDERLDSLRTAISDIEAPGNVTLSVNFKGYKNYFNSVCFDVDSANLKIIFPSGQTKLSRDRDVYAHYDSFSSLGICYCSLLKKVVSQIKSRGGRNLLLWETPSVLELQLDDVTKKVTGKVTFEKLDLVGTILSFKKKYKTVVEEVDFSDDDDLYLKQFPYAIAHIKSDAYSNFLFEFNDEIKEFSKAVVELKYLATLASYFNTQVKNGVSITLPELAEMGSKTTIAKNLINPNLIGKVPQEEIVANDVSADENTNLFLITGPNNNGKTTYVNSIGLAQGMTQAGMFVFSDSAEFSLKDNILTHYIRPGDLVVGESRYAHELSRIKAIFETATSNSLIIMDEPCSGTSPADGRSQLKTVFRGVGNLWATGYVTTHFHDVADVATQLPYANNLHCVSELCGDDLVYTYRIEEGFSDQSNGSYLARRMGLDMDGINLILSERNAVAGLKLR